MAAFSNRITALFGIKYPVIQAGMIWASGWRLASAVSNAGGLGIIGAGSMDPETLRHHIRKCSTATDRPFAVNLPLLYAHAPSHIDIIIEEKVPIVFTSAGNPKTWTSILKARGIVVVHVVSSSRFALKAEEAGCDAVVAEGFEAGGHNGREETTTLVLVPAVVNAVSIPVIAAGGIVTGRQMFAVMALGASAAQFGTRFVASEEASSHPAFKQLVTTLKEGDTSLVLKQLTPVRLVKNGFYGQVADAELKGATAPELATLLGRGRSRLGMFEGDLENGELEIGQAAVLLGGILPASRIVEIIWSGFTEALANPLKLF